MRHRYSGFQERPKTALIRPSIDSRRPYETVPRYSVSNCSISTRRVPSNSVLDQLSWYDIDEDPTVSCISPDSVFSSAEYADTAGIEFPLLSDSVGSVAEKYGVLREEFRGHKRVPRRAVFVIDTDGTIRHVWCDEEPSAQPDWYELKQVVGA